MPVKKNTAATAATSRDGLHRQSDVERGDAVAAGGFIAAKSIGMGKPLAPRAALLDPAGGVH
jgi:hypothetical protein